MKRRSWARGSEPMPKQEAPAAAFAAAGWQVFDSDDEDIREAIVGVLAKEG